VKFGRAKFAEEILEVELELGEAIDGSILSVGL
jgi:hypothetical protein